MDSSDNDEEDMDDMCGSDEEEDDFYEYRDYVNSDESEDMDVSCDSDSQEVTPRVDHVLGVEGNELNETINAFNREVKKVLKRLKPLKERKAIPIEISMNRLKLMFETEVKQKLELKKALDAKADNQSNAESNQTETQNSGVSDQIQELKKKAMKSSFDRFGDDLVELIVGYLSTKDKFRFERISKQFQRLIFRKENVLDVSPDNPFVKHITRKGYKGRPEIDSKNFEKCVQKLKYLHDIRISECFDPDSDAEVEPIEAIGEHCHRLKRLNLCYPVLSDTSIDKMCTNFGKSLEHLTIKCYGCDHKCIKTLLSFSPNFISFKINSYSEISLLSNETSAKALPKLKEYDCYFVPKSELEVLTDHYNGQLVKLATVGIGADQANLDELTHFTSKQYPRLQSLKLNISKKSAQEVNQLSQQMKQLAANCPQLTRLEAIGGSTAILSSFTRLTSLKIISGDCYSPEKMSYGSFTELKPLSQLKHLKMIYNEVSDGDCKDIGHCLPQLESLIIESEKRSLTDKSLRNLSQLKRLKTLEIHSIQNKKGPAMTDTGIKRLIDSCPDLRRLVLINPQGVIYQITSAIVDPFKERAKQMPKIRYYLRLNCIKRNIKISYRYSESPDNLKVDFTAPILY